MSKLQLTMTEVTASATQVITSIMVANVNYTVDSIFSQSMMSV